MRRRWTEEEETLLVELVEADGLTCSEIAERLNRSKQAVVFKTNRLRKQGLLDYIKKRWTEDEIDYIVLAAEDGESTLQEIADFLGRTTRAVSSKALAENISIATPRQKTWSKQEESWLKRAYSTASTEEMCRYLKRSEYSIRGKAQLLGLRRTREQRLNLEKVKELASQGLTSKEIADRLGTSRANVSNYCWRHGIKTKPSTAGLAHVKADIKRIFRKRR